LHVEALAMPVTLQECTALRQPEMRRAGHMAGTSPPKVETAAEIRQIYDYGASPTREGHHRPQPRTLS
jgi:hypothetical protein